MRRPSLLLSVVLGLATLAGCSGGGPYCDAVDAGREPLATFGEQSDAAFSTYADVTTKISRVAPADVKKEWKSIAVSTKKVVIAHRTSGLALEDMKDEVKVNALSKQDIDQITAAHEAFNDTKAEREDVVEHVHDECGIDLSKK
ncbi:hypothetical protein IDH50_13210 [Aeromicrobium tamlense]|uniref:Lipoprotein n=1 Tax=Aeromicrobium tamlense TaxID=375541 RepID=A0A8I0G0A9_9ACTN|nr:MULTISPECIES: hypothetical protein [Aeromicrobium]MBD1270671.1 hypothetical protein [Aeromicrobium tamlense]MBD1271197.1 hypothetical protein [Aeromicrobium tamlense]NYI38061.1 hypothetical protein [Aeromicrobium tamlense]